MKRTSLRLFGLKLRPRTVRERPLARLVLLGRCASLYKDRVALPCELLAHAVIGIQLAPLLLPLVQALIRLGHVIAPQAPPGVGELAREVLETQVAERVRRRRGKYLLLIGE